MRTQRMLRASACLNPALSLDVLVHSPRASFGTREDTAFQGYSAKGDRIGRSLRRRLTTAIRTGPGMIVTPHCRVFFADGPTSGSLPSDLVHNLSWFAPG